MIRGEIVNLKYKMLKYRVMDYHQQLVRIGKYYEAARLLDFLRMKRICLDLSDVDFYVENILEKAGCKISYSSRGTATVSF